MELYSAIQQSAAKNGDSVAFEWEGGQWTYQEVAAYSNVVGNRLAEITGGKRQNIALLIPNTPWFAPSLFGLHAAGCVAVPFNPLLTAEELGLLLSHGDCGILIYDPVLEEKARAAIQHTSHEVTLLSARELVMGENPNPAPLSPTTTVDDLSMILYTSGTTGNPKGVMLSHKNIYTNVMGFTTVYKFSREDTLPCVIPLFHSFAMTTILYGGLLNGARIVLFPQFVPQKVLQLIFSKPNIILIAVPPMLLMTARFAPDDAASTHNLRLVVSGGGPLPVDVSAFFKKKFEHEILEGYGLTETSPVVSFNRPGINRLGTIGLALPDVETQVRDENGTVLGTNEIGELCVRGDLVMQGYYKNEDYTREVMYDDGWLRTGDLASIDDDGYMKIVGRAKDVIVCGGENIYPREIEEMLLRVPGVIQAAVVAQPNKLRSEVPYAFVVLDESAHGQVTESQLRKHCREHLAEYKVPEGFEFIDEMPQTATRKIQKEKLKARFA